MEWLEILKLILSHLTVFIDLILKVREVISRIRDNVEDPIRDKVKIMKDLSKTLKNLPPEQIFEKALRIQKDSCYKVTIVRRFERRGRYIEIIAKQVCYCCSKN